MLKMKIPPVIQFFACALVAWILALSFVATATAVPTIVPVVTALIGVSFLVFALSHFRKHQTTINPLEPGNASKLVTSGIYRVTRNPMYVGLLLILLAWSIWLGNLSALIPVPIFILLMTALQIKPEERALLHLFGDEYRRYQSSVSRWILF